MIAVDPKYTSLTCNKCGYINKENRVSQTEFRCMKCLHVDYADRNAALNFLMRADILAHHKSPSRSTVLGKLSGKLTDLATIKTSVSCFQPASVLKMSLVSVWLQDVRVTLVPFCGLTGRIDQVVPQG